jgi:hypothetical protein
MLTAGEPARAGVHFVLMAVRQSIRMMEAKIPVEIDIVRRPNFPLTREIVFDRGKT